MNSALNNKLDKAMTTEQFTQVVDAILEGKYSWACVLILRFAGYNPLHYIPYRTYNRLMKDNSETCKHRHGEAKLCQQPISRQDLQRVTHQIRDLSYLESLNQPHDLLKGGYSSLCLDANSHLEHLNFKLLS